MKRILYLTIILFLMTLLFDNCKTIQESEENNNYIISDNKGGTFQLFITAKEASKSSRSLSVYVSTSKKEDVLSLIVTIENLEVHRTSDSDAGWISIPISDGTYDLIALDANSWAEIISNTVITPGNYNKIRFKVASANVTTESGVYDAQIPSGVIKINVPFLVHEDGTTEVTIEVDPKASLKITGNKNTPKYILKPVLHVTKIDEDEGDDD